MSSASGTSKAPNSKTPAPDIQEFIIRLPKHVQKKHSVFQFDASQNVDFAEWKNVKLERENTSNVKQFRGLAEDMPDSRQKAIRKKIGITAKNCKPYEQPWILTVGGKTGKKSKGRRQGGVGENSAYYIFKTAPDGSIEASPLNEWYNFQPIQRYKPLSAEEAENLFARREKLMNYACLMAKKRLKGDEVEDEDSEELNAKPRTKNEAKELKISDVDEWIDSDDNDSDSDEEAKEKTEEDSDNDKKKKKTKNGYPDKKKKTDLDNEAFEDSDDGDVEGREFDYISDSSEDEPDPEAKITEELKSVAEVDALRKLLSSSDEDEVDEERESEKDKKEQKEKQDKKSKDRQKRKHKKKGKGEKKYREIDLSSDSDSEAETNKKIRTEARGSKSSSTSASISQLEPNKRRADRIQSDLVAYEDNSSPVSNPAKKPKLEVSSLPGTFSGAINVKSRLCVGASQPVPPTELVTKFKKQKPGAMTHIIKKIRR